MTDDKGTEGLPKSGQTGPSDPPPYGGLRPGDSPTGEQFEPGAGDAPWSGLEPSESQMDQWFEEMFPSEKDFNEWQKESVPSAGYGDFKSRVYATWNEASLSGKLLIIDQFAYRRGDDPFDWMAIESRWLSSIPTLDKEFDNKGREDDPEEESSGWVDDDSYQTTVTMPDGSRRKLTKAWLKPVAGAALAIGAAGGIYMVMTNGSNDEAQETLIEVETVEEPVDEEVESAVEANEPVVIEVDEPVESVEIESVEPVEIESEEPIVLVEDEAAAVNQCEGIAGCDAEGDPDSSRNVSVVDNPAAMAVDIVQIVHESPDAATNVFTIDLSGNAKGFATDSGSLFYQIAVFVDGELPWPESGWSATFQYRDGVLIAGDGPSLWSLDNAGQPVATSLRPASVMGEWERDDRLVVTVFSADEPLIVERFVVSTAGPVFADEAEFVSL